MRTARGLATALLSAAIVTGAAGCDADGGTTPGAVPASGAASGVVADGGRLGQSEAATARANSATVTLDLTVDGRPLAGEVLAGADGRCLGRLTSGNGRADLLRTEDTLWIHPDAAFAADWFAPGKEPAAGKYLQFKNGTAPKAMAGACAAFPANGEVRAALLAGVTEAGERKVGTEAAKLYAARLADGAAEFAVAAEGEPLLLQVVRTEGGATGSQTFAYFSSPVEVAKPPAAEVVDGTVYLKG
ncbi:hypothetical protein ACIA8O_27590 [Kitasatospora sp. NPDC051853]|uniref:hypothetical protein n=1 Tax=Kitasatospora sp. NPDC051853 TaxID=3364058 RepID=UPI003789D81A